MITLLSLSQPSTTSLSFEVPQKVFSKESSTHNVTAEVSTDNSIPPFPGSDRYEQGMGLVIILHC